ncbi:MAG TPA: NAD(P)-binding domain-containing protein [Natronosporangium sp.]|nr:NAD(P)-binding domain-containing protein [Natronosporangium sp.]
MSFEYGGPVGGAPDWRSAYDRGDTVCVIGAGASGLVATKNLVEHGFGVDCYDRETSVGGIWNWRHDRSPVYATAHLISSRPATGFPDFPMPDSWPDYPHHSQVLAYLQRYADHFDLRRHIWFGTEVVRVRPVHGGRWEVTTRSTGGYTERTHRYAAVVVANGHHWYPHLPEIEGLDGYTGETVHASAVKDPTSLRGRRVLIVGAGNTGCDLAAEAAAQRAAACWLSTRRGYWYIPKYVFGRPVDQVNELVLAARLPLRVRQWLFHRILRLVVGDLRRFGLPRPDHRVYESHPIVNSQLIYQLGHGRVIPVADVARFGRTTVELVDGVSLEPDLVVFATGYLPRFEFLDPHLLAIDDAGRPHLPLHMFSPREPTLAVAGLLQPDSGLFPLVHWQTVAIARWLRVALSDPPAAAALQPRLAALAARRWHDARLRDSARHWFEVSHVRYLRGLQRLLDLLERAR